MNFDFLSVIASIVLVFLLGYLAKKTGVVKYEHSAILNNLIINITLPALIFKAIYKANLTSGLVLVPLIGLAATSAMVLIAYLIAISLKLDRQLKGSFILAAGVGNTGYIAYPILIALFGDSGLVRGILYDMFGTVFFMLTVGIYICSIYGQSNQKPSVIKQFFSFPPLYALILGFAVKTVVLPDIIMRAIDIVAAITIGLILISIGISLEPAKGTKRYYSLIGLTILFKLALSPIFVSVLGRAMQLQNLTVTTTILSASMPTALLTLVFGQKYQLNVEFLSSVIFVSTIASILTIPLIQYLLVK